MQKKCKVEPLCRKLRRSENVTVRQINAARDEHHVSKQQCLGCECLTPALQSAL